MAQGAKYMQVAWDYDAARPLPPPDYPPNITYLAEASRRNKEASARLHEHLLQQSAAIKCITTVSTPNLEWSVVLVAGHMQQQHPLALSASATAAAAAAVARSNQPAGPPRPTQQPHQKDGPPSRSVTSSVQHHAARASGASPAAPAAGASGASGSGAHLAVATAAAGGGGDGAAAAAATAAPPLRRPLACFHAYFLPYKAKLDMLPGKSYKESWLDRRLRARRNKEKASDIHDWQEDRSRCPTDPRTGLPVSEPMVCFRGYWDRTSSLHAAASGPNVHVNRVESVMPGRVFYYSCRPWRQKPESQTGSLEPVVVDRHSHFLEECLCNTAYCGKLSARRELRRLREHGVQYAVEVRLKPLQEGRRDLGLFAEERIPRGSYVCEYVGELITFQEMCARTKAYDDAGLHYMYDLAQRAALRLRDGSAALSVVDATHIGNVGRFINHHCEDANVVAVNVCMGGLDDTLMTVMIRTTRDIVPGDQLLLDYQAGLSAEQKAAIRAKPVGEVTCRCGAASCLGVLFPSVAKAQYSTYTTLRTVAGGRAAAAAATPSSSSSSEGTAACSDSDGGGGAAAVVAGGLVGESPSGISGVVGVTAVEDCAWAGREPALGLTDGPTERGAAGSKSARACSAGVAAPPTAVPGGPYGCTSIGHGVGAAAPLRRDPATDGARRAFQRPSKRQHLTGPCTARLDRPGSGSSGDADVEGSGGGGGGRCGVADAADAGCSTDDDDAGAATTAGGDDSGGAGAGFGAEPVSAEALSGSTLGAPRRAAVKQGAGAAAGPGLTPPHNSSGGGAGAEV